MVDRVLAPAPANGAALNVSTGAQSSPTFPYRAELLGAPQGEKEQMPRAYGFYSVLSTYGRKPDIQRSRAVLFFSARSTQYASPALTFPLSSFLFPLRSPRRQRLRPSQSSSPARPCYCFPAAHCHTRR